MVVGAVIARSILIPEGSADESRSEQLARARTIIGFGFVAGISLPYRSIDDSLDRAWGNFNVSIGIALGAFVVLSGLFWLFLCDADRDQARAEWPRVWDRFGKFVVDHQLRGAGVDAGRVPRRGVRRAVRARPAARRMAARRAAVLVSVAVVSATILVTGGTAQQLLCPNGLVNCVGSAG